MNVCAQYIWNHTQIFFSGYITVPDITAQNAILGCIGNSIEHFLLINHLLLIYKCLYKARDSRNKNLLAFKNNIKIKTLEERTIEERKFLKKWQISSPA